MQDQDHVPAPAIRAVVANFSRRASWLEASEIQAEAAFVCVVAERTWLPGGAPLASYQATAVAKHLGRYIRQVAAPMSIHSAAVSAPRAALEDLANLGTAPAAEFHIDLRRAAEEVRRILAHQPSAAQAVLLDERNPADVAADLGIPVKAVYVSIKKATRALQASQKLRELARAVLS